jgi:hypothetical protein
MRAYPFESRVLRAYANTDRPTRSLCIQSSLSDRKRLDDKGEPSGELDWPRPVLTTAVRVSCHRGVAVDEGMCVTATGTRPRSRSVLTGPDVRLTGDVTRREICRRFLDRGTATPTPRHSTHNMELVTHSIAAHKLWCYCCVTIERCDRTERLRHHATSGSPCASVGEQRPPAHVLVRRRGRHARGR